MPWLLIACTVVIELRIILEGRGMGWEYDIVYSEGPTGMGKVVELGSKGNIGSTVYYCNIGGLGIAVGIIRCIGGVIRFLRIIGSFKTL